MSTFTRFVRALLPVSFANDALKVAPEVQAKINRLLHDTEAQINGLRAQHSVQSVKEQVSKDIADFEAFAKRHVALLQAEADAKVAASSLTLPTVATQLGSTGVKTGS